ncbi:hypothetical protein DAEQUDRAFT_244632 [Daedalea quercina L-15889]|uniref:MYND-type domain-containing protein n=1 Tax=Daedalea quercina L-15889 TaxID=1314783 RepID=A0A165QT60_9APHY|nr:hypothetical protein DAEQUDRAFT_244632 [Daedalea quercina L-15889]
MPASSTVDRLRFRAIEAGLIRNKSAACDYCMTWPSRGQHFPVCKRCHHVAYCSRACQEAAWLLGHKSLCEEDVRFHEEIQTLDADPNIVAQQIAQSLPPMEHRCRLFEDFTRVYKNTAQCAISAAMRHVRREDATVDFTRECMCIDLAYQRDCGGNPSLAYSVVNAQIYPAQPYPFPTQDVGGEIAKWSTEPAGSSDTILPNHRTFVELVPSVEWCTDDGFRMSACFLEPSTVLPHCGPSPLHVMDDSLWFCYLQRTIAAGLVLREQAPEGPMYVGFLKKSGPGWRWRPLKSANGLRSASLSTQL